MHRRSFLKVSFNPQIANKQTSRTQTGLNPYSGPWTVNQVQHLLKRTMFGSTKDDIDYFSSRTLSQTLEELLSPAASIPSPPVNNYSPSIPDADIGAGQTWVNKPTYDGVLNSARRSSFKSWWVGQMINQGRSIQEKMTLFWANHFGTETATINVSHFVYWHHVLLRQYALGNFKQMIKAVTIDSGMLRYLNGYLNTASAPDENYARELQELFTVGKGNPAEYTEDDVKNAARVLTGWRIDGTTFVSFFDPARHDNLPKKFSSFYNNTIITGRSGSAGATETDDLLNMIFAKREVASFICRKLYRWFVYYIIDEETEKNVIQPLANIFRVNNYELKPVLHALLMSEHFFDINNHGCQIKSPVDHVVGCCRELNVGFPNAQTAFSDTYGMWNYIFNWMSNMGQNIGDPPDVSGWPPYYQAPMFYELWINSDTLPKRNRFTDTMLLNGYTRNGKKIMIDPVAFARLLSNPSDPNALLNDILSILYRVPITDATKQMLKQQILLSNQVSDYYWTDEWKAYIVNPADQAKYNVVNSRLRSLLQFVMNSSEYQLA